MPVIRTGAVVESAVVDDGASVHDRRLREEGRAVTGLSGAVAAVLELTCKQRTRTERRTRFLPPYRRVVRAK